MKDIALNVSESDKYLLDVRSYDVLFSEIGYDWSFRGNSLERSIGYNNQLGGKVKIYISKDYRLKTIKEFEQKYNIEIVFVSPEIGKDIKLFALTKLLMEKSLNRENFMAFTKYLKINNINIYDLLDYILVEGVCSKNRATQWMNINTEKFKMNNLKMNFKHLIKFENEF